MDEIIQMNFLTVLGTGSPRSGACQSESWPLCRAYWCTVWQSLGSSMLLQMTLFWSLYGWVVFHCVYIPLLLCPFPCRVHSGCSHGLAIVNSAAVGFPSGASGEEPACQCRRGKRCGFNPGIGKIPWRRKWQPTPVFLPRESHGQRSLVGYSPWGCKELEMTGAT